MAMSLEQVRDALRPEEPDYQALSLMVGPPDMPHLRDLAAGDDMELRVKATYLASLVQPDDADGVVASARSSGSDLLRVTAAQAAQNLEGPAAAAVLEPLLDDGDAGVRRTALLALPAELGPGLQEKVRRIAASDSEARVAAEAEAVVRRLG